MSQYLASAVSASTVSASTGSLAEFEAIYRANFGPITAFFARRTRDPHLVADLTSETFVAAVTSFASFDPTRGSPRAWLFGIARHIYQHHCAQLASGRDAAKQFAGRRELDQDQLEDLVNRIDSERDGRELMERWARLPGKERLAVELVDLAGLTPLEAATALGVTSGALRIRLFRARTKLRATKRRGDQP